MTSEIESFVERLIGTTRQEFLDHVLFWNSVDLESTLYPRFGTTATWNAHTAVLTALRHSKLVEDRGCNRQT